MAKPFSIQAPENIAKEYGGNKQKIAQAAQMGIVDPTAAVLAGMFIDRMRSAQVMEAAQQPTVAQQVLGGGQPQGAPPAPQQGMGPPPQGMPMPPQGMGAPPPQDMGMAPPPQDMGMAPPPQGMAAGGLTTLPVPDAMFDEPDSGSYAGGGMVAFASGGPLTDEEAWSRIKRIEGGLGPKGEMRVSSAGAVGPSQLMPATAPEAAKLAGLPWDEKRYRTDPEYNEALGKAYYLSRVAARKGDYKKAALDYHSGMGNVDKGKIGPAGRDYARKFSGAEIPERDLSTAAGVGMSYEDAMPLVDRLLARSPEHEAAREAFRARATEMGSDEYYEKERKADMWQTLAEIGFNMASSKSPYVLQAIGEAAAASMPGARADKKERKALKDRALQGLMMLGEGDEKKAREALSLTMDMTKTNIQASQFERELQSKENIAANELIARTIAATAKEGVKPNSFEAYVETFYKDFIDKGYPENKARQFAYGAAKIAMEKINAKFGGTGMEGSLNLDGEKTGSNAGEKDPFADFETVSVRN